jgi:CheY-like chemotaxis protein
MRSESAVMELPVAVINLLLLEDNPASREDLARELEDRGFRVQATAEGEDAASLAVEHGIDVALIDLALAGDFDGIDAAEAIQRRLPAVPLIFLTAYIYHQEYLRRVAESGLRVAKWIQKGALDIADLIASIEQHVAAAGLSHPAASSVHPPPEVVMNFEATIDGLYDRIHTLIQAEVEHPELRREIAPLVDQLRALQRQEADAMERRYRAQLLVQPGELRRTLAAARSLLGK